MLAVVNSYVVVAVDSGEAEGQDGDVDETLLSGRQRNGRNRFVCRLPVSYAQRNQDNSQLTEVVVKNYLNFFIKNINFGHVVSGFKPEHSERLFQNIAITFVKYKLRHSVESYCISCYTVCTAGLLE